MKQPDLADMPAFETAHLIGRGDEITIEIEFEGREWTLTASASEAIPRGARFVIWRGRTRIIEEDATPLVTFLLPGHGLLH
jgi:hypothetical protein